MNKTRWKAPPRANHRGRREASCQRGSDGTSSAASLGAIAPSVKTGRSAEHKSWYRLGRTAQGERVFYHPYHGLAVEKDHTYLIALPDNAVVRWEQSPELEDALRVNLGLAVALPARYAEWREDFLIDSSVDIEDLAFAEQCERERDNLMAWANSSLFEEVS